MAMVCRLARSLARWGASERASERTDERADGLCFSGGGRASERASERKDGRPGSVRSLARWGGGASERTDGRPKEGAFDKEFLKKGP